MTVLPAHVSPHEILIFTDGASKSNPGPSGWGVVIAFPGQRVIELGGSLPLATNNQMEMQSILEALRYIAPFPGTIQVCSDSAYALNGIQKWVHGWRRNAWTTSEGKPVANQALWEALDEQVRQLQRSRSISWIHLPGHAGIAGNERADAIATGFAEGKAVALYQGPLAGYGFDPFIITIDPRKIAAKNSKKQKAYSYLSLVDGVVVRHLSWPDCQARVLGKAGAKFKKTLDAQDEEAILRSWQSR
jgi:ribonuclease HI